MAWGLPSRQTVGLTRRVTATPSATLHRRLVLAGNSFPVILTGMRIGLPKCRRFAGVLNSARALPWTKTGRSAGMPSASSEVADNQERREAE